MKKCLIIDDDPLICDLLKHFCSKQEWIGRTLSVGDGSQALQAMDVEDFDLVFLDFNLPDLKGRNVLDLMPRKTPTIMVTSEESFGAESYEFDQIIDFLLKPVSYERFLKAVQRFRSNSQTVKMIDEEAKSSKNLMVKDGNKTVVIRLDEIRHIKSESNYVVFYLNNQKVMSLQSLKHLEETLPENFVRIQKSFIANLNFLDSITADYVTIEGVELPIGSIHKESLAKALKKWNNNSQK